ncbi:MAG: hypothetical protein OSB34_15295 [Planktomarina sp.]|nr:hypothetical protein [Planktomarina sp.]
MSESELEIFDASIKLFAEYLKCDPSLVREVYRKINIDLHTNVEDTVELRRSVEIYKDASKLAKRLRKVISQLPEIEKTVLSLSDSSPDLIPNISWIEKDLKELFDGRSWHLDRNRTKGGRNIKADLVAEMVLAIMVSLDRKVTYGVDNYSEAEEPATEFTRAVKKALEIFRAYKKTGELGAKLDPGGIIHWRQPAHKAFLRMKGATKKEK